MLLDNINCDAQPLDQSEETDTCEVLGGCAPACTATRPCPRMVCIPQGISTESAQILDLLGAATMADGALVGSGLEVLHLETDRLDDDDMRRMWRLMVILIQWLNRHRSEIAKQAG